MVDREAIVDNARYLQQVRPIDPEEISEYVEGQPHPAVVKRVLREEALELGLVERDDGTFEPVSDDPVPVPSLPVTEFPEQYAPRLEDLLVEAYGPDWHRGESGDDLRSELQHLKRSYHRGWDVEYGELAAHAYAIYHLPDYYAAVQYVLAELAEVDLLDRHLRILDVGAGVGGPMLGICDALPDDALLEYHAIEPSGAADVFEAMAEETGRNVHVECHRTTAEAFDLPGERATDGDGQPNDGDDADASGGDEDDPYDIVLFGNVLSELSDPIGTARRYLDAVVDDGALCLLSPADRHTCRTLRIVERALVDADEDREEPFGADEITDDPDERSAWHDDESGAPQATVFSPTVRLWPHEAPTDEGWSFAVRPDLEVPPFQRRLDEAAGAEGEFVNVDVQYSYATLRRDGQRRIEYVPDRSRWAKLAESERTVSQRVDCVAVKLSADLSEGGNPLFRVGDGSQREDHFAVLTNETALNADLAQAEYGDLLTFESVLVLWNDDEEAYNLVVDEETFVEVAPAPVR